VSGGMRKRRSCRYPGQQQKRNDEQEASHGLSSMFDSDAS
jgi:hypothetical protein